MIDAEFEKLFEQTLLAIEEALDATEADIDYERSSGNILTLYFANQSKMIINPQVPLHQLWIAAKSGGFHLNYEEATHLWKTDDVQGQKLKGEPLFDLLSRLCTEQANQLVTLK